MSRYAEALLQESGDAVGAVGGEGAGDFDLGKFRGALEHQGFAVLAVEFADDFGERCSVEDQETFGPCRGFFDFDGTYLG